MNFNFQNQDLEALYYEGGGWSRYPESVAKAFFRKMSIIKNADNENDLRALKGNHFEKLQGGTNTYSIRLNDQFRLIFIINKKNQALEIIEISNHYS